jgi:hypothetical protein
VHDTIASYGAAPKPGFVHKTVYVLQQELGSGLVCDPQSDLESFKVYKRILRRLRMHFPCSCCRKLKDSLAYNRWPAGDLPL